MCSACVVSECIFGSIIINIFVARRPVYFKMMWFTYIMLGENAVNWHSSAKTLCKRFVIFCNTVTSLRLPISPVCLLLPGVHQRCGWHWCVCGNVPDWREGSQGDILPCGGERNARTWIRKEGEKGTFLKKPFKEIAISISGLVTGTWKLFA